jgi:hypothetical protein
MRAELRSRALVSSSSRAAWAAAGFLCPSAGATPLGAAEVPVPGGE